MLSLVHFFCFKSSVMEMSTTSEWLDPPATPSSDVADTRGCVSEMGPTPGSDGVPSDTTEDDWSRGSPDDPDEGISPARSPSPMSTGTSEHGGSQMSDLDRKVNAVFWTDLSYPKLRGLNIF